MIIEIATAVSRQSTNWRTQELEWSDFVERLRTPRRTEETALQYHTGSKEFRDKAKDVGGFVGGRLHGSRRTAKAVMYRTLITLDLDNATPDTLEQIRAECDGWAWVAYSTHSHTKDKPRFRLVLPLDRQVTTDEYQAIARRIAGDMDLLEECDDSTYQPERLMYWASVSQDAEYLFETAQGEAVPADEILDRYSNWQDFTEWPHSSRVEARVHRASDEVGDPRAKEGIVGAFCRAYTISQAIPKFLASVYERGTDPRRDDRYSYKAGSTRNGVQVFDDLHAYSHHGTDPAGGQCLNAYDLVRIHLFGDMDAGCDPRTNITKRPSYKAMSEFALADSKVKGAMLSTMFGDVPTSSATPSRATAETADEQPDNDEEWYASLELDKSGGIKPSVTNIHLILSNDEEVKGKIYLDEFSGRILKADESLPWAQREGNSWSDTDDAGMIVWLDSKYKVNSPTRTTHALVQIATQERRNPVKRFVETAKWDGVQRLDSVFIDYLGASDTPLVRAMTRKSLAAAVARIYAPGTKYDQITVLAGREGIGKSSLLKSLGGAWFSDSFLGVEGKDGMEQLEGAWLIEIAELSGLKKSEMTAVKAFVSRQEDAFRSAYARNKSYRPRQCVFFGTTNEVDFLRDENGNRRFWVIPTGVRPARLSPWELAGSDTLHQIWAEALQAYRDGEPLYLSAEMAQELKELQAQYTSDDGLVGIISEFLGRGLPSNYYTMTTEERRYYCKGYTGAIATSFSLETIQPRTAVCLAEIRNECLGLHPTDTRLDKAILKALANIEGWERSPKVKKIRGYGVAKVWVNPGNEVDVSQGEIRPEMSAVDKLLEGL